MTDSEIQLGLLAWSQYTDWPPLRDAAVRAERAGYDDVWTWDHLYPIVGSHKGPIFEGWLTLAAWAKATSRVRVGLMVGANTFRNPALVAKMATTLDHISDGRAVLGIGAAWFETEHTAFGIEFGSRPGERLNWLNEAAGIMRGMLDGERPSGSRYYATRDVRNDPPPLQRQLRLLIGGGGEEKTLRIVARYADACNLNTNVGLDGIKRKEEALHRHCEALGRDPATVERTLGIGPVFIRDDRVEAERLAAETFARHGGAKTWANVNVGTPEAVAERLRPFVALGYRHLIAGCPSPFDAESIERFAREVKPLLASA
ncbi:MAG: LLM class flavin-dependent oxidoreductase [Chloroflexota bacterium]|nr:LLM class flavin-dependent oxidoreductase [Chloroflexota bacterium]